MNQFEALTQINLDDLVTSFGWENYPLPARLLRILFRSAARAFARQMIEFDQAVGTRGISEGGRFLLQKYVKELRVLGADRIPDSSFLALSNHPGVTDTIALFSAIDRRDLKIIALERPFLKALPNTSKHLYYVHDDPAKRISMVRRVSSHLKGGGAVLTFPAGRIEPDPDVYKGAELSLQGWTDSVGVFVRMAPESPVLPVLVRGVISARHARHWLLKFKHAREEKEKLATALQLLSMVMFGEKPVTVTVQFGRPVYARELGSRNTSTIHQEVIAEMERLIENERG